MEFCANQLHLQLKALYFPSHLNGKHNKTTQQKFYKMATFQVLRKKPDIKREVLLLLLLLSSSSSPLYRVFILIFLRQTMSLGNTVLQLFCCTFTLALSAVCVQCPNGCFLEFLDFMFSWYVANVFSKRF